MGSLATSSSGLAGRIPANNHQLLTLSPSFGVRRSASNSAMALPFVWRQQCGRPLHLENSGWHLNTLAGPAHAPSIAASCELCPQA
jgi:hypothetical protein